MSVLRVENLSYRYPGAEQPALDGVSLVSDGFIPFRDNIDTCAKFGVKYIVQPGGSVADEKVTDACDQYDMVMSHHGMRLFHH